MADVKISALPAASTPNGAETIVVVQDGTTKRTTISEGVANADPKGHGGTHASFGTDPVEAHDMGAAKAFPTASTPDTGYDYVSGYREGDIVVKNHAEAYVNVDQTTSGAVWWRLLPATELFMSFEFTADGSRHVVLPYACTLDLDATTYKAGTGTITFAKNGTGASGSTTFAAGDELTVTAASVSTYVTITVPRLS